MAARRSPDVISAPHTVARAPTAHTAATRRTGSTLPLSGGRNASLRFQWSRQWIPITPGPVSPVYQCASSLKGVCQCLGRSELGSFLPFATVNFISPTASLLVAIKLASEGLSEPALHNDAHPMPPFGLDPSSPSFCSVFPLFDSRGS